MCFVMWQAGWVTFPASVRAETSRRSFIVGSNFAVQRCHFRMCMQLVQCSVDFVDALAATFLHQLLVVALTTLSPLTSSLCHGSCTIRKPRLPPGPVGFGPRV